MMTLLAAAVRRDRDAAHRWAHGACQPAARVVPLAANSRQHSIATACALWRVAGWTAQICIVIASRVAAVQPGCPSPVRFRPTPPALLEMRKTKVEGELLNWSTMAWRSCSAQGRVPQQASLFCRAATDHSAQTATGC